MKINKSQDFAFSKWEALNFRGSQNKTKEHRALYLFIETVTDKIESNLIVSNDMSEGVSASSVLNSTKQACSEMDLVQFWLDNGLA